MADYKNEFGFFAERPKVEKKIFDRNKVIAGLVIFLVLITIPLWQNLGKTVDTSPGTRRWTSFMGTLSTWMTINTL